MTTKSTQNGFYMSKVIAYCVVNISDVNRYIESGWQLYSAPFFVAHAELTDGWNKDYVAQGMVKYACEK